MLFLLSILACSWFSDDAKTEKKPTPEPAKAEKVEKKAEPAKPKFQADPPAAESGTTPEEKAALSKAEAGITAVRENMKTQLDAVLKGDVAAGIPVCGSAAQTAIDAAGKDGVTVGRSASKLRNPKNIAPDWVSTWLAQYPDGTKASDAHGFARIETTDKGKVARVLKPLSVEASCMKCHGPNEHLKEPIAAAIKAQYPDDKTVGYMMGDLRGAIYAETPL